MREIDFLAAMPLAGDHHSRSKRPRQRAGEAAQSIKAHAVAVTSRPRPGRPKAIAQSTQRQRVAGLRIDRHMDPLSHLTALSPPELGGAPTRRRQDGDREVSQQCSADMSTFLGFRGSTPQGVGKTRDGAKGSSLAASAKRIRLALDLGDAGAQSSRANGRMSMSQLSQMQAHGSSEMNELLYADTQDDVVDVASNADAQGDDGDDQRRQKPAMMTTSAPTDEDESRSTTKSALARGSVNGLRKKDVEEGGDELSTLKGADGREAVPAAAVVDASPGRNKKQASTKPNTDDNKLNTEKSSEKRRESTDSYPDTESLADSDDDDVVIVEPPQPKPSIQDDSVRINNGAELTKNSDSDSKEDGESEAVDTGDLTLNEMARRWKQQQAQEKKVVTAKVIATKTSVIDDDEDLPPTQEATTSHSDAAISPPSSGAPTKSPQSRLALRKRDKLPSRPLPTPSKAIAQQYEYLDSSCKCGEMICQCDLPPDASSTSKQSTAIRNLEFAFAMPESQESESQLLDSAPDVSIMASKALDAMPASTNDMTDRKQPTPSKLLVPPHSSHESSRRTIAATELLGFVKANDAPQVSPDEVEESNAKRETIAASERLGLRTPGKSHRVSGAATINASASTKASILNDLVVDGETKESEFGSPSKKKSTKSQSPVKTPRACGKRGPAAVTPETPSRNLAKEKHTRRDTSPQRQLQTQATSETPSNRKRKRPFQSPDAGAVVHHNDIGTPSRTRAAKANAEEEQKSTPSVRTRPKMISPVPAARSYASRSKSLFKYKFDFCLTGFVGDGESSLVHILEDLGGKVYGQDVLSRGNTRAVVIATPVSWRKRKFMMAVACGIPVVHPEWIHACSKAGAIVPFDGFYVPSGYSVTTRKFECLYPKQLDIFTGYRFGIPFDVRSSAMKASVKDMAGLISSILLACGASDVIEDLNASRTKQVDIVLSDDHTEVCEQYSRKHRVPLKSFGWVTECVIRQQLVDLATSTFQPTKQDSGRRASHKKGGFQESVPAAVAHVGDREAMATLKLYKGELVLADITNEEIDHFLLFHVCEILEIFLIYNDDGRGKRKHEDPPDVILRVGVLKRSPYSPSLSRAEVKVIDIAASQVKRRVVAVAKQDFDAMKYRDESIFYFEDEGEISND